MARPKKASDEKRDFVLRVRVTQTEKQKILDLAADAGCNASDYLRLKALEAQPRTKTASPERAAFILGLAQLGKIGSNVNQIARALNRRAQTEHGEWVPDELIEGALHGVETMSHHLIKLLGHGD